MSTETHLATPGHKTTTDHAVAFYDGNFMPLADANVNVAAHALHYDPAALRAFGATG